MENMEPFPTFKAPVCAGGGLCKERVVWVV